MQILNPNELVYDAFDKDALDRKSYATNIINIINACRSYPKSNDNKSYVIGINASWGSGKTYFDKLLIDFLDQNKEKLNIHSVYYDAWTNDFWDNAFEPFFAQLINSKVLNWEVFKSDTQDILKSATKIIALGIKGFSNKIIEDIFDTGTLDEISSECKKMWDNASDDKYQASKYFEEYSNFVKAISALRSFLENAVEKSGGKIVIFVDELDRCKPTFAIQTLEIVKHLFNIEGLVFIFSLDLEQLSYCVQSVYGEKIDSIAYLERFFNFITNLPRQDYTKVAAQYIEEFSIQYHNANFIQSVIDISTSFNLSLRDLRTILSSLFVLQQTSLRKYRANDDATLLYLYFLSMKYKHPSMLNQAVYEHQTEHLRSFLSETPIPFLFKKVIVNFSVLMSPIGTTMYELIGRENGEYRWKNNVRFSSDHEKVSLMDNNTISLELQSNENLNYLLYADDLGTLPQILHMRLIEYIYTNLELCGSINE